MDGEPIGGKGAKALYRCTICGQVFGAVIDSRKADGREGGAA